LKSGFEIMKNQWRNHFSSVLPRDEKAPLKTYIESEEKAVMPAPYFYAFYDFECSEILFVSTEVQDIVGIDRHTARTRQDSLFNLILPDEKPYVAKHSMKIVNDFFRLGREAFENRLYVHEYRVKSKTGNILHILHQNEILTYNADNLPKLEIARFIDMSWLFTENSKRIVRSYIYNWENNEIEHSWESIVHETKSPKLSPREQEVLVLINQGYTSKQIAASLDISVETVKTHRRNINAKLSND